MSVKAYFTQEETETWYTADSIRTKKNDSQVPNFSCTFWFG